MNEPKPHDDRPLRADDLPPLYQATLDAAGYAALLGDLASLRGPLEVSVKSGAETFVPERARWTLDAAQRALEAGEVRAMQVRYAFEGAIWIDTLMRGPEGMRLVRMQAPGGRPT